MKIEIIRKLSYKFIEISMNQCLLPVDKVNYLHQILEQNQTTNIVLNTDDVGVDETIIAYLTECIIHFNGGETEPLLFPSVKFHFIIGGKYVVNDIESAYNTFYILGKSISLEKDAELMWSAEIEPVRVDLYLCSEYDYKKCLNHYKSMFRHGDTIKFPELKPNSADEIYSVLSDTEITFLAIFTSSLTVYQYIQNSYEYSNGIHLNNFQTLNHKYTKRLCNLNIHSHKDGKIESFIYEELPNDSIVDKVFG